MMSQVAPAQPPPVVSQEAGEDVAAQSKTENQRNQEEKGEENFEDCTKDWNDFPLSQADGEI